MIRRLLATALLWLPSVARADATSLLSVDPETTAVSGSNVAYGRSIGVLVTNPALLVDVDERVHVGLLHGTPRGSIRLFPRPRGVDVARSIYDSSIGTAPGGEDRALATGDLRSRRSDTTLTGSDTRLAVGLVSKLGIERLRVGILASVPMGSSDAANLSTHYEDEREGAFSNRLHFFRLGGGERIARVIASAGVRITDWLSLGVGVRLAAAAVARLAVYVPDAAVQSNAQTNLETSVATSWQPLIGVRAEPTKWLSIGASFRAESAFRVEGASEVTLWNDHDAGAPQTTPRRTTMRFPMVFGWEPAEAALGVAARFSRGVVGVAATYQVYSRFVDHHGEKPETVARSNDYRFRDVIAWSLGGTFAINEWLSASAGLALQPTPVPAQTGRTSFVDNTLIGASLGERAQFSLFGRRFSVAVAFQLWHMLPRETHKDAIRTVDAYPDDARTLRTGETIPEAKGLQTNSPGFPGYRAEGLLLGTSIAVAHHF
jgi:long-chain fatty acid transport protein